MLGEDSAQAFGSRRDVYAHERAPMPGGAELDPRSPSIACSLERKRGARFNAVGAVVQWDHHAYIDSPGVDPEARHERAPDADPGSTGHLSGVCDRNSFADMRRM